MAMVSCSLSHKGKAQGGQYPPHHKCPNGHCAPPPIPWVWHTCGHSSLPTYGCDVQCPMPTMPTALLSFLQMSSEYCSHAFRNMRCADGWHMSGPTIFSVFFLHMLIPPKQYRNANVFSVANWNGRVTIKWYLEGNYLSWPQLLLCSYQFTCWHIMLTPFLIQKVWVWVSLSMVCYSSRTCLFLQIMMFTWLLWLLVKEALLLSARAWCVKDEKKCRIK